MLGFYEILVLPHKITQDAQISLITSYKDPYTLLSSLMIHRIVFSFALTRSVILQLLYVREGSTSRRSYTLSVGRQESDLLTETFHLNDFLDCFNLIFSKVRHANA